MVKQIVGGLAISLLGLLVGLIALEALFRLMESRFTTPSRWSDRPPFYFQHERSPTLQDGPHSDHKTANAFRIAVVGDSYSFAPYMQYTDAFPKVLERMLNLNETKMTGEVINYGVPGYSTSHEIAEVEKAIAAGSDLILLQITLNDPELKPYRPTGIKEFNRFGKLRASAGLESLFHYWHSLRFAVERLHNNKTRSEYTRYFLELFSNPRSRKSFENSVKEIEEKCRAAHVRLVAVVFPLFGLPLDEDYPFHPIHDQVGQLMQDLHIPSLDLYALYQGIPLERLQVIPGGDRHPNEIAHRMAAEKIYSWLVEQSVIPSDLQIKRRFQGRTQIIKESPYDPEIAPAALQNPEDGLTAVASGIEEQ